MGFLGGGDTRINATFTATDKATPVIKSLRTNVSALGSKTGGPLGGLISGIGGLNLGMIGAVGVGVGFVGMLADATKAAIEEDKGIAQLNASLKANVPEWESHTKAMNDAVDAAEKLAFTDDAARQSLALLLPTTHDVGKAVELMNVAMNLSRLRGTDLAETTTLIGKVYQGNLSSLKRFGISLKGVGSSTEALAKVQEIAAGQAEAYANTTAGHYEQMQIKINDLKEDIGHGLQPFIDVALQGITELFNPKAAVEAGSALDGLIQANLKAAASAGNFNASGDMVADTLADVGGKAGDTTLFLLQFGQALLSGKGEAELGAISLGKYADQLGVSLDALNLYVDSGLKAGMTIGEMDAALRKLVLQQAMHNRMLEQQKANQDDATASTQEATSAFTAAWRGSAINTKKTLHSLGGSIQSEIQGWKDPIRAAMAENAWAIKHPFAEDQLANWLHKKMTVAQRRLKAAMKTGDKALIAEITSTIALIQAEIDSLHGTTVPVHVTTSGGGYMRTRAGGGPVQRDNTYLVGENGPEVLHMGSGGSGYVTQGTSGAGSGWEHTTVVMLDGAVIARQVDRWNGRQQHIAGRSHSRN